LKVRLCQGKEFVTLVSATIKPYLCLQFIPLCRQFANRVLRANMDVRLQILPTVCTLCREFKAAIAANLGEFFAEYSQILIGQPLHLGNELAKSSIDHQ
jgi:hypothetical protein